MTGFFQELLKLSVCEPPAHKKADDERQKADRDCGQHFLISEITPNYFANLEYEERLLLERLIKPLQAL